MLCGVVRSVWDDGVGKGGFSVYGGFYVCGGSVYGYVQIVQSVVSFRFCREL